MWLVISSVYFYAACISQKRHEIRFFFLSCLLASTMAALSISLLYVRHHSELANGNQTYLVRGLVLMF